jgi:hypothetical protein
VRQVEPGFAQEVPRASKARPSVTQSARLIRAQTIIPTIRTPRASAKQRACRGPRRPIAPPFELSHPSVRARCTSTRLEALQLATCRHPRLRACCIPAETSLRIAARKTPPATGCDLQWSRVSPTFRRCRCLEKGAARRGAARELLRAPGTGRRLRERRPPFSTKETAMLDLLFVLVMLGSFGACLAYTVACERL